MTRPGDAALRGAGPSEAAKAQRAALRRAYLMVFVTTLLWGTQAPLMKLIIPEGGLISLAMFRAWTAVLPLVPFLLWQQGWGGFRVARSDLPCVIVLSLIGITLCQAGTFVALSRLPASISVIISNTSPIFMALLAVIWLREPLRRKTIVGIVVSLGGVLLLVLRGGGPSGTLDMVGAIAALVGTGSWAVYTVFGRSLLARYDPLRIVTLTGILGALALVPIALLLEPPAAREVPVWVWWITLYLGVLPIGLGNLLWYRALRMLRAAQIGPFQYLVPLWAVLLANLLLSEPLTPVLFGGAALVFGGLWLTQRR